MSFSNWANSWLSSFILPLSTIFFHLLLISYNTIITYGRIKVKRKNKKFKKIKKTRNAKAFLLCFFLL